MTAEAPKPNEENTPRKPRMRVFDEIQARYRSPLNSVSGSRFGYINFTTAELPDLYGSRHQAADEAHEEALTDLAEKALEFGQRLIEENPRT